MSKKCCISGKTFNNGYSVSHSHRRTKKKQEVNLQKKKIWSSKQNRWLTLNISTKGLRSLNQNLYSV